MSNPRIPRHRAPVIPVGRYSRLRDTSLTRVALGVAIGLCALAAMGAML
jgi:hypothetical protein